jgi:ornithine decarboxylase
MKTVSFMEKLPKLVKTRDTPFLLLDLEKIKRNYYDLKNAIKNVEIYYAVKSNSSMSIITQLKNLGCKFDVASMGEIDDLIDLGVDPENMSFGNTIKKEKDIKTAFDLGINLFVADCEAEVEKIAKNAPGSDLFIRLATQGIDSDWPLTGKFGTDIDSAKDLGLYAAKKGLNPIGVSFHVGSQCYNPYNWKTAIMEAAEFFEYLEKNGLHPYYINLGGGFPTPYLKPIPSMEEIGEVINDSIESYFGDRKLKIVAEPGRYMVGDAGLLVSKVILTSNRLGKDWMYVDTGVFHGLTEVLGGIMYPVAFYDARSLEKIEDENEKIVTLAGPTCDSFDIIYEDYSVPASVKIGDYMVFYSAGAYTSGYNTYFNSIKGPGMVVINDFKG